MVRPQFLSFISLLSRTHRQIFGTITLCLSTVIVAQPIGYLSEFKPYIGYDIYQRQLSMTPGFGKNMFNKRISQNNLFLGFKLNEYIGIEAGQMFTQTNTRTVISPENSIVFGVLVRAGELTTSENRIELHGTHLNVIGQYPINCSRFHLLGSVGFVSLKLKSEFKPLASETGALTPSQVVNATRTFSTRRAIPRLSGGLNYQLSELLGVRVLAGYETTAKFKNIAAKRANGASTANRMSMKNNVLLGMGFTVNFQ